MTRRTDGPEIVIGDITRLDVDAIVNAANEELLPGGGVCGAIHAAAGPQLAKACRDIAPCPTGEARITPGFNLKARYVIHAVGPVYDADSDDSEKLLASAYRASLTLAAKQKDIASIAFPCISTGIYGYPLEAATSIALRAIGEFLAKGSSMCVICCCFRNSDAIIYRQLSKRS